MKHCQFAKTLANPQFRQKIAKTNARKKIHKKVS